MPLNARGQKLKGILKAKGGADASKEDFKTPGSGSYSRSYNPGAGGVVQHGGSSNKGSANISGGGKKTKFPFSKEQIVTGALNLAAFPLGYAVKMFSNKKPKIEKNYGPYTKTKKPPIIPMGGDNNRPQLCPDGSMPPCKPTNTPATSPTKPNFFDNFKAYNSGGVSYGPPPKRGPNPQVPPVKMRNGKMTKKYQMSCPHRPDGIRGVGAAIRGHKFIGVK